MRNSMAIMALSSLLLCMSCKKNETAVPAGQKTENKKTEEFVVDSVKVDESTQITDSLKVTYASTLLVFPSLQNKALLDSIYGDKDIKDFSKAGIESYLENKKKKYFHSIANDNKDWVSDITRAENWYSRSNMKLVSNANGYMHIRYMGNAYIGGAHDEYSYSERVFDLKNNRKLELKDVTSMPTIAIEGILMKNIDKINSGTQDQNGEVKNSEMLLVDKIPATGNFYFDDKNLYFHYSPYEIAAFAAGDIVIPISWEELKSTLNEEFKERMNIK
ncbi:RsiV family protein [Chryseobacterium pennipullorum]|uniref:DUF3298 domain-containing protein n=1 Tax=Chryseobacterium pennipullorum TaxID=2258963 RepID=A0A3D9AZU9_9FLAO|nr:RsiV family protein [Chryseobacterium pennipullorum]REC46492.1 DUF3298 domain-containing protein [Chryseobacterium pennipullorum]